VKVGDFIKMYSYAGDQDFSENETVLDLSEREGIITRLENTDPSVLQVLWNDGVEEWIIASTVEIIPNRDIS